jgi:hypothetical protein
MALLLKHQTAAQFAKRFWAKVAEAQAGAKAGNKDAAAMRDYLVWRVWQWIQDGDLTSDQIRLSYNDYFGKALTATQWNSLVTTRLVPIKDRYLAMLAETDLA